jgi:hypothetical protein
MTFFVYLQNKDQRSLDIDMAMEMLKILLSESWTLLDPFVEFIEVCMYTSLVWFISIQKLNCMKIIHFFLSIPIFIISMTKLLDADWLRGVQLFH